MWSRLLSMGSEQEPEKNEQDFHCKNVLLILGDGGHSKLNFVSSLLPFEKNESYITHKEDDNDYNRSNPHFFSYRQIKFSDLKSNISSANMNFTPLFTPITDFQAIWCKKNFFQFCGRKVLCSRIDLKSLRKQCNSLKKFLFLKNMNHKLSNALCLMCFRQLFAENKD